MGGMTKTRAALAGITAALVAVGLAELVAVFTGPRSAPLVAVDGWVIDHVPEWLKQFAISVFGTKDKLALLTGTAVVLLLIAAAIGLLARRSVALGVLGISLFALVGAVAAGTREGATVAWVLPSVVGGAAAALTLYLLVRTEQRPESESGDRRTFLKLAGLTAAGAVVAGLAGRALADRRGVAEARSRVELPAPAGSPAPAPSTLPSGYVTTNREFYRIDTSLIVPQVDPDTWRLRIHGAVDHELTITYAELLAMPMIERYVTLACVSNEVGGDLIGNARWLGVPVKSLLERAAPHAGADQVVQRAVDGWTCGTPTQVLLDGRDAMLAVGMNGEPLPVEHGFPVRMVVPGLYGYVSACKWITELELTTFAEFDAYWVRRGWSAQAPIKTQSRIDTPTGSKHAGDLTVAGVAWAQHRGIAKVEVQISTEAEAGRWQEAELLDTVSVDTWKQWRLPWSATPGEYTLTVRATDATGETQTERRSSVEPDGATGWHSVGVRIT
ncbi:MAG: molybdopterin-dependent oxidoreductase [Hamadaea sp.]|nr:molybdopterin-dependent oxidoreductase [Hamadaea sp.]